MAKYANDLLMDEGLEYLETNGNLLVLCDGQPSSYGDATTDYGTGSGVALGEKVLDSADWTVADGTVSGRKATMGQQTAIDVDVTGDCDHVAIVDTVGEDLLLVTTVTEQTLTAGGTATVNAFKDEIADAA